MGQTTWLPRCGGDGIGQRPAAAEQGPCPPPREHSPHPPQAPTPGGEWSRCTDTPSKQSRARPSRCGLRTPGTTRRPREWRPPMQNKVEQTGCVWRLTGPHASPLCRPPGSHEREVASASFKPLLLCVSASQPSPVPTRAPRGWLPGPYHVGNVTFIHVSI